MKDRTCWSNFTSTICHWNQNNERKTDFSCEKQKL